MIEFKNVVKQYPNGFRAVDDLNLLVPEGEICVLIGPSGCGKTTSMRMINRLISITSGEILIDGQPNTELPAEELRRQIGYAIQQIGLLPHMTIADNIALVPRLLHWDENRIRRRVDELLELVGLDPDISRDKYPRQLSGGQQQRVGVARALGADPPIMLMDEPFGAVDPITREVLQAEFLQIQERVGKTIIFVTHDIDEAIKMGDRIAIMRDGHLVQYDTPDTILAHPINRFVRDFVGTDRTLKRLGLIRIKNLMDTSRRTVTLDASIEDAARIFRESEQNCIFIVDKGDSTLKGWIDREEMKENTSLTEAMFEAPWIDIAVRDDATAREALSAMVARGFRITPVVDRHGKLVGTITLKALQDLAAYDPDSIVETSGGVA
ncbi:betaine/proline/choline family ABC transporter ATP-binding protein [Phototrophicus methaneseepsis]|uniref:ABC-type quaternary amine transporter n=1 Tax=Phototrophicus methaneseepsis TaxID=2710758 RepID=A0A7S8IDX1_9CHLR|nr:betaine/proline/choline family ABC transporter ATP-binding protein [Phototrophicus methaneseepsis]QPC81268.1 betaine/proline/choline family ABC transporter ATP-binding protein [Phototrophicus methaneseepsis]